MCKAVLIDDDQENIEIIKNSLLKYRFFDEITLFTDPLKAIEGIKEINPEVVFTDVEMPGMNGLELAQYVIDFNPGIKLVFITAYDYYAIEAFELYALDYILKPIRQERLDQTMKRLMGARDIEVQGTPAESLSITVFGRLDLFSGEKHIRWKGAKTEELFAYLLHNLGKNVMKETIIDIMWSGYEYKYALRNMQTAMCRVRQSLNELGDFIDIEYSCNCYSLKVKNVNFDYLEFEALTKDIQEITDANVGSALKALEIYQGDYLETNGYLWSLGKQAAIKNRFFEIYIKLTEYCDISKNARSIIPLVKSVFENNSENRVIKSLLKKCQSKLINRIVGGKTKYFLERGAMTNVLNRRDGFALLKDRFCKAVAKKEEMSICFVDINGVGEVNDKLGHNAGNELILGVINGINKCIRQSDFIIRFGGDEFLVVFQEADVEQAEKVWERIEAEFKTINSGETVKYVISVSHGIIGCDITLQNVNVEGYLYNLISLADKRMYNEKQTLKSQIKMIR